MVAALLVMIGLALSVQKPDSLSRIPLFAPTPTPTPLASANITVLMPLATSLVSQEFEITGKARVLENIVTIRLKDKISGQIYSQVQALTTATEPGTYGDFSAVIQLEDADDAELLPGAILILEVFQISPTDGREIDKVIVPLKFQPIAG